MEQGAFDEATRNRVLVGVKADFQSVAFNQGCVVI
jgi:hypothetical protein